MSPNGSARAAATMAAVTCAADAVLAVAAGGVAGAVTPLAGELAAADDESTDTGEVARTTACAAGAFSDAWRPINFSTC